MTERSGSPTEGPAPAKKTLRVLLGALGCLGLLGVVLLGVAGSLLFLLDERLFRQERRERVHDATCDGERLTVDYVSRYNGLAGVTTDRHLETTWQGQTVATDGRETPVLYTWGAPPRREHGEGEWAVHFFVGDLSAAAARSLERCVEAEAEALLEALGRSAMPPPGEVPWTGRGRVYWSGAPDDLVPTFTSGEQRIQLERDGRLTLVEEHLSSRSESLIGEVRRDEGGLRLECCEQRIEASELGGFVDAQGRSLPERLGVEPVPPTRRW